MLPQHLLLITDKDQAGGYLGIASSGNITYDIGNIKLSSINSTSINNYLTTDNFLNHTNYIPPTSLTNGAPVWDGDGNLNINSTKIKDYQGAAGFGNLAAIELGFDNGAGDDPDLHGSYLDFHASHNISSNANNNLVANDYAARIIRYGTGPDSNGWTLDRAGQLRIQQTGDDPSNKLVLATSQQVDEDNFIDKGVLTIEPHGTIDLNGVQIYPEPNLGLMKVGNTLLGGDNYPFLIMAAPSSGARISLQAGPDDDNGAKSDAYHKAQGHHFFKSITQLAAEDYTDPDENGQGGSEVSEYAWVSIGGDQSPGQAITIWGEGKILSSGSDAHSLVNKHYVDLRHADLVGFFDYRATNEFTLDSVETGNLIPNNVAGNSILGYGPKDVDSIWNEPNSQFVLSSLSTGDMIDIRLDIELNIITNNTEIEIDLITGVGSDSPQTISFFPKTRIQHTGVTKITQYKGIHVGYSETRNFPAEFRIYTDHDNVVMTVKGFYCKITKRL